MCQNCDAINAAEENRARRAQSTTERRLESWVREKIVRGNTCVILEPEITSLCWDVKEQGEKVSPEDLDAFCLPKMFKNVKFILNQDGTRFVGIEVT